MKIHFSIFFVFIPYIFCTAQLIKNSPVQITVGTLNLNPEIIKKNKIKSIEVVITNKPDGQMIVDKGSASGYRFNNNGYITNFYYTILNTVAVVDETKSSSDNNKKRKSANTPDWISYINDTIFTEIKYDSKNRISEKIMKSGNTFDIYHFEYDSINRIKKETRFKQLILQNDSSLSLGKKDQISAETFIYQELTPTQTKKSGFNSSNKLYKKTVINYDAKKNIVSERNELIASWFRQEHFYWYNSSNQLIKKTYKSNESGLSEWEWIYEYGKNGNLVSEKKFKNKVLMYESNYLYDDAGLLLKSEAARDYQSHCIIISKFQYAYY